MLLSGLVRVPDVCSSHDQCDTCHYLFGFINTILSLKISFLFVDLFFSVNIIRFCFFFMFFVYTSLVM